MHKTNCSLRNKEKQTKLWTIQNLLQNVRYSLKTNSLYLTLIYRMGNNLNIRY